MVWGVRRRNDAGNGLVRGMRDQAPRGRVTAVTACNMRGMRDRTSITVRSEQQAELARAARALAASEDRRVTLADMLDRLLDHWRKTGTGKPCRHRDHDRSMT